MFPMAANSSPSHLCTPLVECARRTWSRFYLVEAQIEGTLVVALCAGRVVEDLTAGQGKGVSFALMVVTLVMMAACF